MSNEEHSGELYIDFLPNHPQNDATRERFRELLSRAFTGRLAESVERIWDLPQLAVLIQADYLRLLVESRDLYIEGHFYPCVAMCGIVAERLVKDTLRLSVCLRRGNVATIPPETAFDQLERVEVRGIINFLKEGDLLSEEAAKAAISLGELRNAYAHARGRSQQSDALKAILFLHSLVEGTVSVFKDHEIQDGAFVPKQRPGSPPDDIE